MRFWKSESFEVCFAARTRKKNADRRSNLMVVRREKVKSDAVIVQKKRKKGGIAQLARASALQAEGRRFDSDYLHNYRPQGAKDV